MVYYFWVKIEQKTKNIISYIEKIKEKFDIKDYTIGQLL